MIDETFSIMCRVCNREVNSFHQSVKFILLPTQAVQEAETIYLSCGCVVDFPDWQINVNTGMCQIYNFAGTLYVEFMDEDILLEGEE